MRNRLELVVNVDLRYDKGYTVDADDIYRCVQEDGGPDLDSLLA